MRAIIGTLTAAVVLTLTPGIARSADDVEVFGAEATPVQPLSAEPVALPPAPSAGYSAPVDAYASQPVPAGQWVYTAQYGWIWMPYGDAYANAPANGGVPTMYAYYPAVGWCWLSAPWVWGWGPMPYFGVYGYAHYGWWGHGYGHWYGFAGHHAGWYGGGRYWHGGQWHGAVPAPARAGYGPRNSYGAPARPGYGAPGRPSYGAPSRTGFGAPHGGYQAPRVGSAAPHPSYAAPRGGFAGGPRTSYAAPRGGFAAPHGSYAAPRGGGFAAPRGGFAGGHASGGSHAGSGGGHFGGHGGGGHR